MVSPVFFIQGASPRKRGVGLSATMKTLCVFIPLLSLARLPVQAFPPFGNTRIFVCGGDGRLFRQMARHLAHRPACRTDYEDAQAIVGAPPRSGVAAPPPGGAGATAEPRKARFLRSAAEQKCAQMKKMPLLYRRLQPRMPIALTGPESTGLKSLWVYYRGAGCKPT
jgi:hypothetical protein